MTAVLLLALAVPSEDLAVRGPQLLALRCGPCHGDDPEGGLRLDQRQTALAVLVPGDPDASRLVRAIRREDARTAMPPKKPLAPEEAQLLEAWVRAGAPWSEAQPAVAQPARLVGLDGAGPMPLRRLTRDEYLATVQDLLRFPLRMKVALPEDPPGPTGFAAPGAVSPVEAKRYLAAAEELSAAAVHRREQLLPCAPAERDTPGCARAFIHDFGRRAFRRPLAPVEQQRLEAIFRRGGSVREGFRLVVQAMLMSPHFLYLGHGPPPSATMRLSRIGPYETASRLSYVLTGSMPDEALFAAATSGKLATAEGVMAEARRLLATPRAEATVLRFFAQWLHLDKVRDVQKDKKLFPLFGPKLVMAMEEETRTFIRHVFFAGDARWDTMLTAPFSFVNEPLAKLYGIPGVKGAALRRVELPPGQRAGVLTHASFLAVQALPNGTSPVKRGKTVLEDLLCLPPPPPPAGLEIEAPKPDPRAQTRELYRQHAENKACRGCHQMMDPIGFAFESYDALGAYRREENGRPVDTTGVLIGLVGGERRFATASDLVRVVADSDEGRRCVVKKWLRYALGRHETREEEPSVDEIYTRFAAAGFDMRELVVALTGSRAFLHRVEGASLAAVP